MEGRILAAEERLEVARSRAEDPAIAADASALAARLEELEESQREVDGLYARWAVLGEKRD
jgi:ATP-binding cassette subfamily F protein uup